MTAQNDEYHQLWKFALLTLSSNEDIGRKNILQNDG